MELYGSTAPPGNHFFLLSDQCGVFFDVVRQLGEGGTRAGRAWPLAVIIEAPSDAIWNRPKPQSRDIREVLDESQIYRH